MSAANGDRYEEPGHIFTGVTKHTGVGESDTGRLEVTADAGQATVGELLEALGRLPEEHVFVDVQETGFHSGTILSLMFDPAE